MNNNQNRFSLYLIDGKRYVLLDPKNIDFPLNEQTTAIICNPQRGIMGADAVLSIKNIDSPYKTIPKLSRPIIRYGHLEEGLLQKLSNNHPD